MFSLPLCVCVDVFFFFILCLNPLLKLGRNGGFAEFVCGGGKMRLCTFLQNHTLKIAFKAQCHPAKREGKPTGLLGEIRYIETRKRARERESEGEPRQERRRRHKRESEQRQERRSRNAERERKRDAFAEIVDQGCKRSRTHNQRLLLRTRFTYSNRGEVFFPPPNH